MSLDGTSKFEKLQGNNTTLDKSLEGRCLQFVRAFNTFKIILGLVRSGSFPKKGIGVKNHFISIKKNL